MYRKTEKAVIKPAEREMFESKEKKESILKKLRSKLCQVVVILRR